MPLQELVQLMGKDQTEIKWQEKNTLKIGLIRFKVWFLHSHGYLKFKCGMRSWKQN